jgi:hypothetical protein
MGLNRKRYVCVEFKTVEHEKSDLLRNHSFTHSYRLC